MIGHHDLGRAHRSALLEPFNLLALLSILGLVVASLVAQADAHFYAGGKQYDRHTVWMLIGLGAFLLTAVIDLRFIERGAYAFYGVCVALLLLTLFVGTSVNNSTRWLRLGDVNIQASEFVKLGVIVALARFLHQRRERAPGETATPQVGRYGLSDLLAPVALVLVPAPLILLQPDLGTTLMVLFVAATMLAVEGIKRKAAVVLVLGSLILVPVAWKSGLIQEYQKDRVFKLVDDRWEKVDKETGIIHEKRRTQAEQAMWAIGSGGLTGQGRQNANAQRMRVFPEVHTDFISAMVAEEFGFLGLTVLLFMFWWLVVWGLRTALDSRARFCRLVAAGVAALFGWQVFVNVGMVTGFLPVVGVPLPFLSYGGSAFLTLLMCLGLVLNIARKRGRM
jgi:rod shape determining protein RodA